MPASLRRSGLLLCAALSLGSTCALLSGCLAGCRSNPCLAIMGDSRAAIAAVGKSLSGPLAKLTSNPASGDEARKNSQQLYDAMLNTDVSGCPKDFRNQYQTVLASVGEFNYAVDQVPVEDLEKLRYLMSQVGSNHPDFQVKEVLHNVEVKRQEMFRQMTELRVIAHKYGVDQDF
jgi:hypothetical protein